MASACGKSRVRQVRPLHGVIPGPFSCVWYGRYFVQFVHVFAMAAPRNEKIDGHGSMRLWRRVFVWSPFFALRGDN